jgi:hypothetical protein
VASGAHRHRGRHTIATRDALGVGDKVQLIVIFGAEQMTALTTTRSLR